MSISWTGSAHEDLIWTGNWEDVREFMDRVGYSVPFLGHPAIFLGRCDDDAPETLHVANVFTQQVDHCDVGDRIRWYRSTRSFSVIKEA